MILIFIQFYCPFLCVQSLYIYIYATSIVYTPKQPTPTPYSPDFSSILYQSAFSNSPIQTIYIPICSAPSFHNFFFPKFFFPQYIYQSIAHPLPSSSPTPYVQIRPHRFMTRSPCSNTNLSSIAICSLRARSSSSFAKHPAISRIMNCVSANANCCWALALA